ncbi:uncharacterized protein LOC125777631 [Bactrocera dorsalis]|uniref:Uncharacterized protein LOC125777631 n=1 Tax=Bactrocera dorsalis TaxID=27457 RepID=A0ABM3JHH2_BACDO|nr:uncharacterized protein LOC125777631 [Bactrocera dorsalis]
MAIFEKCIVERVNKSLNTITLQEKLLQPLESVYLNLSIVQFSKSLDRVLYTFKNVDACSFLNRRRNPVIRLLYEYMKTFSNVNHSCPFRDYIYLRNFVVHNVDIGRLPILKGEYGVMSSWILNGIGFTEINIFGVYD